MRRRGFVLFLLLSITIVTISACGGGGGGGGGEVVTLKTTSIRLDEPGDYWTYSTSMTIDDFSGTPATFTGDVTYTNLTNLVQNPYTSDWCIDNYFYGNISGLVIEGHSYFQQDSSGSYYYFGQDAGWIIQPSSGYVLTAQSPMAVGQNLSFAYTLDNGDFHSGVRMVQAIEEVSYSMGIYEAFKVTQTNSVEYASGDSLSVIATSWIVPGLGMIKSLEEGTYFVGGQVDSIITLDMELISTNVSY